jgi:ABC-2 type transport system permease protein
VRRLDSTLLLAGVAVIAFVLVAVRHRPEGVTAARIEQAFAPTFGNLVHLQRGRLKLPEIDRAVLQAAARCQKVAPASTASLAGAPMSRDARGAGDWTCTVSWTSPGRRVALRDTYDLTVTPEGCYTATADSSEAHIGGRTLTARDGTTLTNLLYTFEGCFDTTGR